MHETHARFVWNGEQGAGDIGRYQIRHLTREDIALEKDFANTIARLAAAQAAIKNPRK